MSHWHCIAVCAVCVQMQVQMFAREPSRTTATHRTRATSRSEKVTSLRYDAIHCLVLVDAGIIDRIKRVGRVGWGQDWGPEIVNIVKQIIILWMCDAKTTTVLYNIIFRFVIGRHDRPVQRRHACCYTSANFCAFIQPQVVPSTATAVAFWTSWDWFVTMFLLVTQTINTHYRSCHVQLV